MSVSIHVPQHDYMIPSITVAATSVHVWMPTEVQINTEKVSQTNPLTKTTLNRHRLRENPKIIQYINRIHLVSSGMQ